MIFCNEKIWLDENNMTSTYCMLARGHAGNHSIGVQVQKREECTLIPEGVSCTETPAAYYIRVREGSEIVLLRVIKKFLHVKVSNTHVSD